VSDERRPSPARRAKDRLKAAFPTAAARYIQLKEHGRRLAGRGGYLRDTFSRIHAGNLWGEEESVSGPGASLAETRAVREELPQLLRELGARSLLDAPCGDCHWIERLELGLERYVGVDIVPELIARNQRELARPGVEFARLDLTWDRLPRADLVLCRDCLIHLSYHYIFRALGNFQRSGAAWLLTTTYSGLRRNHDILSGQWRPLDLELPPFGLPPPRRLLHEKDCEVGGLRFRRNLGLWRLAELGKHGRLSGRRSPTSGAP
jgi:SAM-dependent methyltransferase